MASVNLDRPKSPTQTLVLPQDIPILYEDDGREGMGEANPHTRTIDVLFLGMEVHLQQTRPELQVFSNLNAYYRDEPRNPQSGRSPYFSADIMVVSPPTRLPESIRSYRIGVDGPAPLQTTEVLSESSADLRDLD